jgi:hypothetical protein
MRHVCLTRSPLLAALVLAAPLALYACGGEGSSTSTSGAGGSDTSSSTTTTTSSTGGTGGASSSSTSGSTTSTGSSMLAGKIKVTVSYTGKQTGPLLIAAVTSFPPMGPPDAATKVAAPVFPQVVELPINAGSYYVTAILDVGNNYMNMPGPEDLVVLSMGKVDVKGNDAPTLDLALKDKM